MTIDGLALKTSESFPKITAELTSTVYLSPKTEGATAGGTPQGPAATPAATPAAGTDAGSSGAAPAQTSGSGGAAQ